MNRTIVSAVIFALLATPAMAQMGHRHQGGGKAPPSAGPQIDEKAYKAALDRIPDSKQKYDPWGGVVPPQTEKGKKKP